MTLSLMAASAHADPIELFDWGISVNGSSTCSDPVGGCTTDGAVPGDLPGSVGTGGFDFNTGLGTISVNVTGAGLHSVLAFFDHEIDETINTFFNEWVELSGVRVAGQSAEGDEPGYLFGDIVDNFLDNTLDNMSDVPQGLEDDASMAMGWNFVLGAGETAVASFILSSTDGSGALFNLTHGDDDSADRIYFWSTLDITGGGPGPTPIPEPGTLALLGLGLGLLSLGRKRIARA